MTIQRFAFIIFFFGSVITYAFWPSEGKPKTLPNLTEQPGLMDRNPEDLAIIDSAANQTNPTDYLRTKYGDDALETRIRNWFNLIDCPLSPGAKITLIAYTFTGKETIRQQVANINDPAKIDTLEGLIDGRHLFVRITEDPKYNGERMLRCLNGMVGNPVEFQDSEEVFSQVDDGVRIIENGGSVCGSLDLTWQDARDLAQREGLSSYWKKKNGRKTYFVEVQPGDQFKKVGGTWQLVKVPVPVGDFDNNSGLIE